MDELDYFTGIHSPHSTVLPFSNTEYIPQPKSIESEYNNEPEIQFSPIEYIVLGALIIVIILHLVILWNVKMMILLITQRQLAGVDDNFTCVCLYYIC